MALYTISATGGNFGSVSTWVEGVVPTSSDDIIGLSFSGDLIMNASYNVRDGDFSDYTGTINCSQSAGNLIFIGGYATFSSNMRYLTRSGGGIIGFNGQFPFSAQYINPQGLTFGRTSFFGQYTTKVWVTPLNIDCTYDCNLNPATDVALTWNTSYHSGEINLWNGGVNNSTDTIRMVEGSTFSFRGYTGSTCFWDTSPYNRGTFVINTEGGTFYNKRPFTSGGAGTGNLRLIYISGNLGHTSVRVGNGFNSAATVEFVNTTGMTFSTIQIEDNSTLIAHQKIKAENVYALLNSGSPRIIGTQGFHFNTLTIQRNNTTFLNNPPTISSCELVLENGGQYTIDRFVATGLGMTLSNNKTIIRAATASGTPCSMTVGNNSVLGFLDIRDIDATSTTYVLGGETLNTLTRTTGFTTSLVDFKETSHTFIL